VFGIDDPCRYSHLRFHIYPDGGVARLRVHGDVIRESLDTFLDLAAAQNGGRVADATDMYFGSRHNLIFPGRSTGMHDGWETRRRRGPGHDWCLIELAAHGKVHHIEVDTSHFKGNFPESCSIETEEGEEILPRVKLEANKRHIFQSELKPVSAARVRFRIYPDGGVSRLRIFGSPSEEGRAAHRLRLLNALTPSEARKRFLQCCGSPSWATAMTGARPFPSPLAIFESAERIWRGLEQADWLEAFAAHPRIGERTSDPRAAAEQSGTRSASGETLDELRRLNEEYASKFGYIFIVYASGKSADQMLQLLRARLSNDPATEIANAAEEQLAITKARLEKIGS
jgi:allantoicase